jgi:hypothetical protein
LIQMMNFDAGIKVVANTACLKCHPILPGTRPKGLEHEIAKPSAHVSGPRVVLHR